MARKKFTPGIFVMLTLPDGSYGYGRLREDMNVSFYNFRTEEPTSDLDKIASKPVLFTVGVHKTVLDEWEIIGRRSLGRHMKEPVVWFWQDIDNFSNCRIIDSKGSTRAATSLCGKTQMA